MTSRVTLELDFSDREDSVSTICSLSVAGILIILLLDLRASIIREGALATSMNLEAFPTFSIILRR